MKKVLLLILFSITILGIRAQGYVPKVGETIMFYPLTEKAKQEYHGYDCFYDATKVISNGKYKFKKGYQYKCSKNGLTPFDEIEGKTFKVLKAENYLHNGKKENKEFLLFLSCIDDGSEIVLRIPFYKTKTNLLTHAMVDKRREEYGSQDFSVNLPCISTQYFNNIKTKFLNKELLYKETSINNARGNKDFYEQVKRNEMFHCISSVVNSNIFGTISLYNVKTCIDIRFESCNISNYAHPFAICIYENETIVDTIKIPLTYIVEKTPYYNEYAYSNYLFENYFVLKSNEVQNIFLREKCISIVDKFTGKDVYYGLNNRYYYDDERLNSRKNINVEKGTNYGLIVGRVYKCLNFDVFPNDNNTYDVYAILQDSLGTKFRVPAKIIFAGTESQRNSSNPRAHYCKGFQDYFTLLDEALAQIEQKKQLVIQKEKEEKERYASWVKKYGATYAKYINELSELGREKFERLVSKYGKDAAKMMVEGKVRIGWNKQMCRESWGEPDDINKTIGSWGTHEQWVYGEIYCSYLYFENGILTTIQN